MQNKEKGITLVALIITIVVMLILVAVSINLIVNSDLIGHAEKTRDAYAGAIKKEENLGNDGITIGNETYGSLDEYIAQSKCTHEWGEWEIVKPATKEEEGLKKRTCTKCGKTEKKEIGKKIELVIGALINYHEYIDTNGNAFSTMPSYTSTKTTRGSTNSSDSDATYSVVNNSGIEWIVLGEENGQIKITTKNIVQPNNGGYESNGFKYLRFEGQAGYTNFVKELQEIGAIYGKGKYADTSKYEATEGGATGGRSFEMEDLGYGSLQRTANYIYAKHSDGNIYRYSATATDEEIANETSTTGGSYSTFKYMNMDASESTEETADLRGESKLKNAGDKVTMYQYTYSGSKTLDTSVSKADTYYWLASRNLYFASGYVSFNARYVNSDGDYNYYNLYYSNGNANRDTSGVRPVVYLKSDIQIEYNSETGAYTILK